MSKELQQELDRGEKFAKELVERLLTMNAAMTVLPVTVDGKDYEVTVAPEGRTEQALAIVRRRKRTELWCYDDL